MSRFIWVKDNEKKQHYINIEHIVRVTKVPPTPGAQLYGDYAYILLNEGNSTKTLTLSKDPFDTYEEVISKIQAQEV